MRIPTELDIIGNALTFPIIGLFGSTFKIFWENQTRFKLEKGPHATDDKWDIHGMQ